MYKTLFLAALLAPMASFAAINASSVTFNPDPVAPGAQVDASVHVQLTNGTEWKSTRLEVSIPGPNNDIDVCYNTADATSNGTHVRHLLFNAPNSDGDYNVTVRAYTFGSCIGSQNSANNTLHVVTPPPPPPVCPVGTVGVWPICVPIPVIDVCPLVTGNQLVGPCANTLCVAPATWDVVDQACEAPVVPPTPEEQCVLDGGTWNGESCDMPVPPAPPTEAEMCETAGKTWTGSECIFSSGGGIGISFGIYCDDPIVFWMPKDGKCWDPATRPAPAPEVGSSGVPIHFYWWDSILKKMFSEVR